jgi:acyl carrier protein
MDSASVQEKVIEIVSNQLKKPKEQITMESKFMEDLGADSLDIAEMVMEFEDKFEVNIPDDAESKLKSVGEVVKFLQEQTSKK